MGDSSNPEQVTVLVTGFGPFAMHTINSSWMAVQEMARIGLGKGAENVRLVVREIPVEYKTVSELIPKLWQTYNPQLTVHVGVSGVTKHLTLEQQAFNQGYNKDDVCGLLPSGSCCLEGADDCLTSGIDMSAVCESLNSSGCPVKAIVSTDPGRYLCDFIYYTSLSINRNSTAFIHVPPLDRPHTVEQLAEGLRLAVLAMLRSLRLA